MTEAPGRPGPGWTEGRDHDPGVTLLQLLAWLAVVLAFALALRAARRRRRGD